MNLTKHSDSSSIIRMIGGSSILVVVLAAIVLVYRALVGGPSADPPAATPSADWYSIYFTDPNAPSAKTLRGGPDQKLADAITAARLSVDVAAYDLDLWSLRDALLAAHRRGVTVRMVTESDFISNPEVQALIEAGIEVLGDRRESLMHNKFVVIDRLEVWTGSMNFTVNGAYRNDNNLLRLRSSRLAEDFTGEFEEMFLQDQFGLRGAPATRFPSVTVEGTQVEVFFSPEDDTVDRLVELVQSAESSVRFLAFSFTSDPLASALQAAARGGVSVQGVMEREQVASNIGSEYDFLRRAGIDVRLDGNPRSMHHKALIIDEQIVVTGSYNFSSNAEDSNDENLLVLHNVQIASLFLSEYERVLSLAQPGQTLQLEHVMQLALPFQMNFYSSQRAGKIRYGYFLEKEAMVP